MCRNSANPIKGLKRANGRSQCPNAVDYCQRHRCYFYSCNDYSFLQRSTCPFRYSRPSDLYRSSRLSEVSSSRDRAITNDAASQCRQLSYLPSVGKGKKTEITKRIYFLIARPPMPDAATPVRSVFPMLTVPQPLSRVSK